MNSEKFRIRQEETESAIKIYLEGELDLSTASQFRSFTDPFVARTDKQIILNLGDLRYIDSTGIGLIISILKAKDEQGATLMVEEISPKIKRLFDLTGITKFIAVTH